MAPHHVATWLKAAVEAFEVRLCSRTVELLHDTL